MRDRTVCIPDSLDLDHAALAVGRGKASLTGKSAPLRAVPQAGGVDEPVHVQFAVRAALSPDAMAVEMQTRAEALACRLRHVEVRGGSRVGLLLPSAFVLLPELPLNPAGKVDRRALPTPESLRQESDPDFVLPRTPLEEQVARVWREVLGVDRIGVQDSFWALGGHSLLATRVLSRIEELFRVDLPLQTLFASPTLGGLPP